MNPAELVDVARVGAEHARTSLEGLLGESLSVVDTSSWSLPETADGLFERLAAADGAQVGRLEIAGPPNGAAWVVVPSACVDRLLERYAPGEHDDAVTASVAAEVANIVTGAYVIELGKRWGVDLEPTPADMSLRPDAVREDFDEALAHHAQAFAIGCGFEDSRGSYGLSVVVMLETARGSE